MRRMEDLRLVEWRKELLNMPDKQIDQWIVLLTDWLLCDCLAT